MFVERSDFVTDHSSDDFPFPFKWEMLKYVVRGPFQNKWEMDLGRSISLEEWGKIYALTHKTSISIIFLLRVSKVHPRWYRTPELLYKMYPTITNVCW